MTKRDEKIKMEKWKTIGFPCVCDDIHTWSHIHKEREVIQQQHYIFYCKREKKIDIGTQTYSVRRKSARCPIHIDFKYGFNIYTFRSVCVIQSVEYKKGHNIPRKKEKV